MNGFVRKADDVRFPLSPNYSYIFYFEERFDPLRCKAWMINNWTLSIIFGLVYFTFIFGGQWIMKSRPEMKLRGPLVVWNFSLAIFSGIAAIRLYPEFLYLLRNHSFYHSVCDNSSFDKNVITAFWLWLFILSKAPELVDTVFIVLRKKPLTFLHWFHHVATLVFTWHIYKEFAAIGRWFAVMNLTVHTMMYYYYGLRALNWPVPRIVAMLITSSQILQMIFGTVVSVYAYGSRLLGVPCAISENGGRSAVIMYAFYLYLFIRFFIKNYMLHRVAKRRSKIK